MSITSVVVMISILLQMDKKKMYIIFAFRYVTYTISNTVLMVTTHYSALIYLLQGERFRDPPQKWNPGDK